MSKPASYENLLERVRARVTKSASSSDQGIAVPTEEDPNMKGGASTPGDEALDGKKEKQTISESKENKDKGEAGKTLENENANTHGSGEGDQGPASQHPESLPTEGEEFYSKQASEVVNLLKERLGIRKQAAEAPKEEEEAPKKEASDDAGDTPKKEASTEEESSKKKAGQADEVSLPNEFSTEFHVKLASQLLATEEGREHARSILADAMGAEAVETLIKQASEMEKVAAEQAQFEGQIKQAMEKMSPEERDAFVKSAKFHRSEVDQLENDFEKQAYQQGAMDAAAMEEAGGALPEIPGAESDMTIEEVVMILDQLVQSGEIDPQMADAILQAVMAEMGGEMPGGAPADPAAGGAPAEAAPVEEMPKAASVDSLIDDIVTEKKED